MGESLAMSVISLLFKEGDHTDLSNRRPLTMLCHAAVAWTEDRNLPLMVVGLDQEKAFDRVNWVFMFRVFERLGFGQVFVGWLRTLYTGVGCMVSVIGLGCTLA